MALHQIRPGAKRARQIGQVLIKAVHADLQIHGEQLAGFALVSRDGRGESQTSFVTAAGPIGRSMVAAYVNNALVQHVSTSLAMEAGVTALLPDDPS